MLKHLGENFVFKMLMVIGIVIVLLQFRRDKEIVAYYATIFQENFRKYLQMIRIFTD